MPLRFDPSALLAQGGIIHGFDSLGSAVMNAMNSREARKYQEKAAAAKSAQDESQFSRTLAGQTQREQMGNEAAMARQTAGDKARLAQENVQQNAATARNKASNQTQTFNTLTREAGSTVRGLASGAQRAFTGIGHDIARVLSAKSGSVDGKTEAEWDRVVKEAQAEADKASKPQDFLTASMSGMSQEDYNRSLADLPSKRQTALKAALALRGGTIDASGRAVRAPKPAAVPIEPTVAAPGATTGSVQPSAAPAKKVVAKADLERTRVGPGKKYATIEDAVAAATAAGFEVR